MELPIISFNVFLFTQSFLAFLVCEDLFFKEKEFFFQSFEMNME